MSAKTRFQFLAGARVSAAGDRVVPYTEGQDLYAAAGEPKQFWTVEGGRHTDAFTRHGGAFRKRLADFFRISLTEP